jgi:hypothetical protein
MKKIKLDLVLVATLRPEILEITLNSFYHKLLKNFDVRLIVNIDPIGDKRYVQQDIINVCKKYFPNIIFRTPNSASFSKAVQWGWQQVKSEIFFHLEDDWCLKKNVDAKLINKCFLDPNIVSISLNMKSNKEYIDQPDKAKDPNNNLYIGLALRPSFFRSSYIREQLEKFDITLDPEKQFSRNISTKNFSKPIFKYYGGINDGSMIIDTGKYWREKNKFNKWSLSSKDITYQTKKTKIISLSYYTCKYYFLKTYWNILYCK